MKKLSVLIALAILLLSVATRSAVAIPESSPIEDAPLDTSSTITNQNANANPEQAACDPPVTITNQTISIDVSDGALKGKIYHPIVTAGTKLPAIILTHGFGPDVTYRNLEGQAAELARLCSVVLIHDARGHGESLSTTPPFTFYGDESRDDLVAVMNFLKGFHLVDTERLAILGFSQAGIHAWFAIADSRTRAEFVAAIPYDGYPLSRQRMLPQNCVSTDLARFVDPGLRRPTCPDDCDFVYGVTWAAAVWDKLRADYVDSHPPNMNATTGLPKVFEIREIEDEFDDPAGDFPHLFDIISQYDTQNFVEESTAAYNTVTPPAGINGYPSKRLLLTTGGHSSPNPWHTPEDSFDEAYRHDETLAWLQVYLDTLTPEPPWTGSQVEYVEDSFDTAGLPVFTWQDATAWPLPVEETSTLWLHPDGLAKTTPPASGEAFDTIQQVYDEAAGYSMGMAVTEDPYFVGFESKVNQSLVSKIYTSPPLLQDVILVAPPVVELYAVGSGATSYQVHLRVREKLANGVTAFVTGASACAWNPPTTPDYFQGTPFSGETRIHRFKAGSVIELEFITYDEEVYWPERTALSMTPYLGDFTVRLDRYDVRDTNVQLSFDKTISDMPIFDDDSLLASSQNQPAVAAPTPTPEPLAITAELYPDFTNPGGWRSWAPEVRLACSGGEGQVICPETQFVFTDGISQTVSYTATDEVGTVVTATLTGITVDRTPPLVTVAVPELPAACAGMSLLIDYSVSDALSGVDNTTATFNGQAVNVGDTVLLVAGVNVLNVATRDVAGNISSEEVTLQCDA